LTVSSNEEFGKVLAGLPLLSYSVGEVIVTANTRSGRLVVLKSGSVAVVKDSVEIARVDEPGAVFGELSALLDMPHTADVRALTDTEVHVADAVLLREDPVVLLEVARILARRIVAANKSVVELKSQIQAGTSPSVLSKMLKRVEEVLSVGGASFET
jgi:CRP-like cAMP-binding protein